jgi:hypothetical protein
MATYKQPKVPRRSASPVSRRDAKYADLLRGKSPNGSFKTGKKK